MPLQTAWKAGRQVRRGLFAAGVGIALLASLSFVIRMSFISAHLDMTSPRRVQGASRATIEEGWFDYSYFYDADEKSAQASLTTHHSYLFIRQVRGVAQRQFANSSRPLFPYMIEVQTGVNLFALAGILLAYPISFCVYAYATRREVVPGPKCLNCEYSLLGSTGSHCPECGAEVRSSGGHDGW